MSDLFDFRWEVPEDGYQWITAIAPYGSHGKGSPKEDLFLTDGILLGGSFRRRFYSPLRHNRGLFRNFAEVQPTQEGIRAFANLYGHLGGDLSKHLILPNKLGGSGEELSAWQNEIVTMRQTVALWDMVQQSDTQGLARYIEWEKDPKDSKKGDILGVQYNSHPNMQPGAFPPKGDQSVSAWIATTNEPETLARFRVGDVIQPALFYLQRVVNERLRARVVPRLLWDTERIQLELHIVPGSLIGALWLQFAQAISGNITYRRCEVCGTWFDLLPPITRKSRQFCSNACRSKAYREKQIEAQRLHGQGVPIKEVARRLQTEIATARGWIKRAG
jgi:hypothetical protein